MKYGLQFPRGCSSYILHSIRLSCSIGKDAHPPLPHLSLASSFPGGEGGVPPFYHFMTGILSSRFYYIYCVEGGGLPLGCWLSHVEVKIADSGLTFGF